MSENERVKALRKARGLTLEQFGVRVGVTKVAISLIENAKNNVTDQMRRSICREFGVREEWLRDGVEPMEAALSVSDEIDRFLKDIKTDDHAFRAHLVAVLARLTPEEWELMENMARKLANGVAAAQEAQTPEQRARLRADDFYTEALAEEKAAEEQLASPPTDAKEA